MQDVIETLRARGLIEAETNENISAIIKKHKPIGVYCGFDPTADSLHLGNMVAIMGLAWFRRFGHIPVVITGGATGLIGDPSGKSQERILLTNDVLKKNVDGITSTLKSLMARAGGEQDVVFLNNRDWFEPMSCIEFLRDLGKHFRVGTMLGKDTVRSRLSSEEGISYTEFSYQLLQAYDFFHLYSKHNVLVQLGGADQWGNITAGIDFVRRLTGHEVFGLTWPLLLRSDGKKFGKSESGAIWLSASKLSPYDFYQYLVRVSDQDVIRLLKALTFVDLDVISEIENRMGQPGYVPNTAQRLLADEVTRFVHGEEGLDMAHRITEQAMPGKEDVVFNTSTVQSLLGQVPTCKMPSKEALQARICDVLTTAHFVPSKAEARRLIRNGGVHVNDRKITDEFDLIGDADVIDGRYVVFSLGKKNRAILDLE
jgi:tyrosyl-tRNA synthetase